MHPLGIGSFLTKLVAESGHLALGTFQHDIIIGFDLFTKLACSDSNQNFSVKAHAQEMKGHILFFIVV